MSLIDTWAATGAGAFTLSENGLYTVEGWRVFLGALKPTGIFSVSRWFLPGRVSETTRLLALGIAALLDAGAPDPRRQVILIARVLCRDADVLPVAVHGGRLGRLEALAADEGFTILASPWTTPATEQVSRALGAKDRAELDAAVADPDLDYTPPTDNRPFFFNLLKLRSFARAHVLDGGALKLRSVARAHVLDGGGVLGGSMAAGTTLMVLFITAAVLVLAA